MSHMEPVLKFIFWNRSKGDENVNGHLSISDFENKNEELGHDEEQSQIYRYYVIIMTSLLWLHHYDVTILANHYDITVMTSLLWRHGYDITVMTSPLWRHHYGVTITSSWIYNDVIFKDAFHDESWNNSISGIISSGDRLDWNDKILLSSYKC